MKHIMRRLLALMLAVCLSAALSVPVFATEVGETPAADLSLSAEMRGEQILVTVSLNDCTRISGLQVNVNYDASLVQFDAFQSSGLISGGAAVFDRGGTVVLVFGPGGENVSGKNGELGTLTFHIQARVEADASFTLSDGVVTDTSGDRGYDAAITGGEAVIAVEGKDYSVSTEEPENGAVTVDRIAADEGNKVTVTVTPEEDFVVGSVTVGDAEVTKESETTYSFVMPAKDAKVEVTFVESEEELAPAEEPEEVPVEEPAAEEPAAEEPAAGEPPEELAETPAAESEAPAETPAEEPLAAPVEKSGVPVWPWVLLAVLVCAGAAAFLFLRSRKKN